MRLICPSCDAQYEVADNVIPETGRDVQCSNCGTTWFQKPVRAAAAAKPAPKPAPSPLAEPEDEDLPAARKPPRERISKERPEGREDPDWRTERPAYKAAPLPPESEEEDEEETAAAPEPPVQQRPRVSADAASILREEAMRELKARLSEKPRVETQPDFGLMPPREPQREAPRPAAPAPEPTVVAAPPPPVPQRNRLPAIEDVDIPADVAAASAASAAEAASYRRAFRSGFGISIAAGIVAGVVYAYAPQIATRVPAAEPALTAYVAGADNLRTMLNRLLGEETTPSGA